MIHKTRNCHDVKPGRPLTGACFGRQRTHIHLIIYVADVEHLTCAWTTNIYSCVYICGRQRALDPCLFWLTYIWGRLRAPGLADYESLGGKVLKVRAGLTFPAGLNLLPAWLWCCAGLCAFAGNPLSLPSHQWVGAHLI